jgi:hypothetical protein
VYDLLFEAGCTRIVSGGHDMRSAADNWQDIAVGSPMRPRMMSECCGCWYEAMILAVIITKGV